MATEEMDAHPKEKRERSPKDAYSSSFRTFMAFLRGRPKLYPKGYVFEEDDLRAITPDDICRYMCKKTFGKENPDDDDRPTHGTWSAIKHFKKSVEHHFPNNDPWDPDERRGNPVKSKEVEGLIKKVKMLQEGGVITSMSALAERRKARQMEKRKHMKVIDDNVVNGVLGKPKVGHLETLSFPDLLMKMESQSVQFMKILEQTQSLLEANASNHDLVQKMHTQNAECISNLDSVKTTLEENNAAIDAVLRDVYNIDPSKDCVDGKIKIKKKWVRDEKIKKMTKMEPVPTDKSLNEDQLAVALFPAVKSLHLLWTEYEFGLCGNKPAKDFTIQERNLSQTMKAIYYRRNQFWRLVNNMTKNSGLSVDEAIDKIHEVYGKDMSVTDILRRLIKDKPKYEHGVHPSLMWPVRSEENPTSENNSGKVGPEAKSSKKVGTAEAASPKKVPLSRPIYPSADSTWVSGNKKQKQLMVQKEQKKSSPPTSGVLEGIFSSQLKVIVPRLPPLQPMASKAGSAAKGNGTPKSGMGAVTRGRKPNLSKSIASGSGRGRPRSASRQTRASSVPTPSESVVASGGGVVEGTEVANPATSSAKADGSDETGTQKVGVVNNNPKNRKSDSLKRSYRHVFATTPRV